MLMPLSPIFDILTPLFQHGVFSLDLGWLSGFTAQAAEHGADAASHGAASASHGPAHHRFDFAEYFIHSNLFNFLIVVVFFYWVFQKFNLIGKIDGARLAMNQELDTVEIQRRDAQQQLEAVQKRVASLQSEVETILKEARESAEAVSSQILEDAQAESDRIVENARKQVLMEQKTAVKSLQNTLLNDAVDEVRRRLRESMDPADHRRAIESVLDELPQVAARQ